MNNRKYQILQKVRNALPTSPVKRSDCYGKISQIMKNRLYINELIGSRYISEETGNGHLHITPEGLAVIEAEEDKRRESVRYWISTVIAILALLISIIALLSQLGILRLLPGSLPG